MAMTYTEFFGIYEDQINKYAQLAEDIFVAAKEFIETYEGKEIDFDEDDFADAIKDNLNCYLNNLSTSSQAPLSDFTNTAIVAAFNELASFVDDEELLIALELDIKGDAAGAYSSIDLGEYGSIMSREAFTSCAEHAYKMAVRNLMIEHAESLGDIAFTNSYESIAPKDAEAFFNLDDEDMYVQASAVLIAASKGTTLEECFANPDYEDFASFVKDRVEQAYEKHKQEKENAER